MELFILGHDVEMNNVQPLSRLIIKEGMEAKYLLSRAAMDHADHCISWTPAIEVLFAVFWAAGIEVTWISKGYGRTDVYLIIQEDGEAALALLLSKGFNVDVFIHETKECLAIYDLYPRGGGGIDIKRSQALRTLEKEIR